MRASLVFATLAACGGGHASTPVAPKQPAVDERKAEKDAKGLLTEIYQSIGHGDTDGLMSLLSDPIVVFGPRRGDALGTRSDTLVALKAIVDPKAKTKPSVQSGGLVVVASPGGHSAWAIDLVTIAGQPHAVSCVLTNTDDLWTVSAATLAHTPSMKEVRAELKREAVVPPGMAGVAKLDGAGRAAADKLTRGLADQKVWGDDLASRTDAIVIGPAAGDVTRGKKDIKKLFDHRLKSNVRATAVGDITASATADGQLAWASAAIVRFEDNDDPLPLRVFAIFERSADSWTMIALQESLALDEPGVGANFKKVVAPALPPPPEEAKKPDDAGKKKKTTTTKKKKKKKKKSDDD
jgi:ketosteroid isomerase-like protein